MAAIAWLMTWLISVSGSRPLAIQAALVAGHGQGP
jgi:hypothetical protein